MVMRIDSDDSAFTILTRKGRNNEMIRAALSLEVGQVLHLPLTIETRKFGSNIRYRKASDGLRFDYRTFNGEVHIKRIL